MPLQFLSLDKNQRDRSVVITEKSLSNPMQGWQARHCRVLLIEVCDIQTRGDGSK